jgi:hypothetical protein
LGIDPLSVEAEMKTWIRPFALMSLAWTMSCASHQSASLQADGEPRARLISCAQATIPGSTRPLTSLELRYKVNTEGKVSEVRVVPNMNANHASDAVIAAATDVALSCVYEPAMQAGQPVATTVSRWFTVDTPGAR